MKNYDMSTLFSSLNKTDNSFDFMNYASIKNGSYGKLLKSYYSEQKNYASEKQDILNQINGVKNQHNETKMDGVVNKNLTSMKKESDELKAAAGELGKDDLWKQIDGKYDVDKIAGAVKKFAEEYNDTVDQTAKVSANEVKQNAKYMTDLTNVMSKNLAKVGVTLGVDGKLSVDEDALKKADMKDMKALFRGSSSYGNQIAEKAGEISSATVMNGLYGNNGAFASSYSSLFNTTT